MQDADLDGAHVSRRANRSRSGPRRRRTPSCRPAAPTAGPARPRPRRAGRLRTPCTRRLLAEHRGVVADGVDGIRAVRTGREQQVAPSTSAAVTISSTTRVAMGDGDAVLVAQFVAQQCDESQTAAISNRSHRRASNGRCTDLADRAEPGHRDAHAVGHDSHLCRTARLAHDRRRRCPVGRPASG